MVQPVIRVEQLSKSYRVALPGGRRNDTLVDAIGGFIRHPFRRRSASPAHETFWALRDVSFEVQPGEIVGIIGRNGAGKSTLLKVLSRITAPTEGRVEISGRVASLLEVGTGFHGELTGRENVYMNGSILGMTRAEIDANFDAIVDFAGVERFLDTPLKRYSSGMQVRLAFAVAAHLDPEILIVDEVLAVGDQAFQEKCLNKMHAVTQRNRTVLFVSHNVDSIRRLCKKGVLLQGGRVEAVGPCDEVVDTYLSTVRDRAATFRFEFEPQAADTFHVRSLECLDADANLLPVIHTWDPVRFRFTVYAPRAFKGAVLALRIASMAGTPIFVTSTHPDHTLRVALAPGLNQFDCEVGKLMLSAGLFSLTASLAVPNLESWDEHEVVLKVEARDVYNSGLAPASAKYLVPMDTSWSVVSS